MLVERIVHDRHRHRHGGLARFEVHHAACRRVVDIRRRHAVHVLRRRHVSGGPADTNGQATRTAQGHGQGEFTVHLGGTAIGDRDRRRVVVIHDRPGRHAIADHDVVGHLRRQGHSEHFVMLIDHVVGHGDRDGPVDRTRHAGRCRLELDRSTGANSRVVHVGGRHPVRIVRRFHLARHHVENYGQATGRIERDREDEIAAFVAAHVGDRHRGRLVVVLNGADGHLAIGDRHQRIVIVRRRHERRRADRHGERLVVLVEQVVGYRYGDRVLGIAHLAGCCGVGGHEDQGAAHGHVVGIRDRHVVHAGGVVIPGSPIDGDHLAAAAGVVQSDGEDDLLVNLVRRDIGDRRRRGQVVVLNRDLGRAHGQVVVETVAGRVHVDHFGGDLAVGFVERVVVGRDGELRGRFAGVYGHRHRRLADGRPRLDDGHHHIDLDKMIETLAHAQRIEDARQREHRVRALGHLVHVGGDRDFDVRSQRRRRNRTCRSAAASRVHGTYLEHVGRTCDRAVVLHAAIVETRYGHAPRRSAAGDLRPGAIAAGTAFA